MDPTCPYPTRVIRGHFSPDPATLKIRDCPKAFGRGLYLVADVEVAERYLRDRKSALHVVDLYGDPTMALDLDLPFRHQSDRLRDIVMTARRWMGVESPVDSRLETRAIIPWVISGNLQTNPCLAHLGIWMLHGTVTEEMGAKDEGKQICLIAHGHFRPVGAVAAREPARARQARQLMAPPPATPVTSPLPEPSM